MERHSLRSNFPNIIYRVQFYVLFSFRRHFFRLRHWHAYDCASAILRGVFVSFLSGSIIDYRVANINALSNRIETAGSIPTKADGGPMYTHRQLVNVDEEIEVGQYTGQRVSTSVYGIKGLGHIFSSKTLHSFQDMFYLLLPFPLPNIHWYLE